MNSRRRERRVADLDPRYVQLWCRSAYAFELLEWDHAAGYRLTSEMRTVLLDVADPLFIGGRMQFVAALYEDFRAFPDYLVTGGVWPRSEHDPWLLEALKNTTKPDSGVWTETVLPQAPATLTRLEKGGRLLDVGAGFALIHYARRFTAAAIAGVEFDEPSFLLARRAVADAGVGDRVEVRHGDANQLADVDAYDLVTMSITLAAPSPRPSSPSSCTPPASRAYATPTSPCPTRFVMLADKPA